MDRSVIYSVFFGVKPTLSFIWRLLKEHVFWEAVVGFWLFALSAVAAVFWEFPYFYSSFVVGLFLFFDALEHHFRKATNLDVILPRMNTRIIFMAFAALILTDLILGQIVFRVWYYPYYKSFLNWIFLYVVIYPVGGLSVLALFRVIRLILSRELGEERFFRIKSPGKTTKLWLHTTLYLFPASIVLIATLFFTGTIDLMMSNQIIYALVTLFIFYEWSFFFDVVTLAYKGRPLLYDFLDGEKKTIVAILLTGVAATFIHEFVNTHAWEWRYVTARMPFTRLEIFQVPVALFVGWVFLAIFCVTFYRMAKAMVFHHINHAMRKEYF